MIKPNVNYAYLLIQHHRGLYMETSNTSEYIQQREKKQENNHFTTNRGGETHIHIIPAPKTNITETNYLISLISLNINYQNFPIKKKQKK